MKLTYKKRLNVVNIWQKHYKFDDLANCMLLLAKIKSLGDRTSGSSKIKSLDDPTSGSAKIKSLGDPVSGPAKIKSLGDPTSGSAKLKSLGDPTSEYIQFYSFLQVNLNFGRFFLKTSKNA